MSVNLRHRNGGNAVIEVALMAPWIFFLFVGVLDFGFYAYSFISVENAARAAVLLTSQSKEAASDQQDACTLVLNQLQGASSYGRTLPAGCNDVFSTPSDCKTQPCLYVNASLVKDSDGEDAAQVEVRYATIPMIPIPAVASGSFVLANSFVIDRIWQMKVNAAADY